MFEILKDAEVHLEANSLRIQCIQHWMDHKGYERFQSLLSQLEIHGAGVSTEDANQKFLRSLPLLVKVSLFMRINHDWTSLSFDDLYNNLRVFENDVKGSTASSSNLQNVAFVSENTNSTNEVSTAYGVSNTSGHCSKHEQTSTSSYSLLASQSSCPQLDHEDLDQVDEYDLEEMDLKWQVAMISMRIKKFYKKTGRKLQFDAKEPVGFDKTKVECYNCHKTGHFARECRTKEDNRRRDGWNPGNKDGKRTEKKEESRALVTVDGESQDQTHRIAKKVQIESSTTHHDRELLPSGPDNIEIDDYNIHMVQKRLNTEPSELVSEPVVNESNVEVQPKYESDSDDEYVTVQTKRLDTPNFANKQVKTPRENVKNQSTNSQKPKVNNKELGNESNERACFVCGSFSHLIRDCDYHVKLAKQVELNKQNMSKGNSTGVRKPIWNNVQRDYPHRNLQNKGIVDSGCFRHMTGNKDYLADFQDINGDPVAFGGGLACLIAKATADESNFWHRRLGHVNFKNLNRLVKGNLVRGLPTKLFQNDQTCVACQKGKQHKVSCKPKLVSSISNTLQLLHMDLFGPTSVRSINHKTYCLVITDDFSRFSWTFFLRTKDETSAILKDFIRQIENQLNQKVKIIRCDNGTEFKNKEVIEFCGLKGIKREYSNKTPYELLTGKTPIISYIRPFGCHVTILNTIDHLGKFVGKSDEGFLVGYSLQSKAFRVYNLVTKRVEENLHITFLENKPNVAGKGPNWLFDLDYLTDSMNYLSVSSENQANIHAGQQETNQNEGTKDKIVAGDSDKEDESAQDCFEVPYWHSYSSTNTLRT
ncbi:putative ribonuclease H-like domain-containing protein [Tanacetum coccineum]|uniref:Ribonuclease H-like domain-containing protein n=1 Tax=Tanacetum coccineum TaxID=301880 RepID=A0ABQ4XU18_9ASTR